MADASRTATLAAQIAHCIGIADSERLHTVAAHLDAALVALRGTGIWPEDEPAEPGAPLH